MDPIALVICLVVNHIFMQRKCERLRWNFVEGDTMINESVLGTQGIIRYSTLLYDSMRH
jgi:hypothetical protein